MLVVSILAPSTIFLLDFGNVPTVEYFLFTILFILLKRELRISFASNNKRDFGEVNKSTEKLCPVSMLLIPM